MQIDMSVRDQAFLIGALTDRASKLKADIQAWRKEGELEWARKAELELQDVLNLKERIWNA